MGRAAERKELPQCEIVGLELRPMDARQMYQVQVGAAEGLGWEDAAVHRQDDGALIGDAGRVAHPHHLDRCAALAAQLQFLGCDKILGERRPLVTHQRAEPRQFVAQRDRPLEGGAVGLVELIPPGSELGDEIPPHGPQPIAAADRIAQAVRRRKVHKREPRRKVDLPAERPKEELPQIEREPLVQRHDEELPRIAMRLSQKGVDLRGKERRQGGPFGKFAETQPLARITPFDHTDSSDKR